MSSRRPSPTAPRNRAPKPPRRRPLTLAEARHAARVAKAERPQLSPAAEAAHRRRWLGRFGA